MNKSPLFSIIIPTFNRADQLGRALNSIEQQTIKDYEVIVCDDGSSDRTKEVVEEYKRRIDLQYLWEENWGGPARPRNNGIRIAQGEYIAFLDSDDWWYPNKLEVVSKYMGNSDVGYHDLDVYSPSGMNKVLKIKGRIFKQPYLADILCNENVMTTSSVIIKKDFLSRLCVSEGRESNYAFNEGTIPKEIILSHYPEISDKLEQLFLDQNDKYFVLKPHIEDRAGINSLDPLRKQQFYNDLRRARIENFEDFDLWLRLAMKAKDIMYIPQSLGAYWVGKSNRSEAAEWYINGYRSIYHRYIGYLGTKDQQQAWHHMSYIIGRCKHKMAKYSEAWRYYRAAIGTDNLKFKFRALMLMMYLIVFRWRQCRGNDENTI